MHVGLLSCGGTCDLRATSLKIGKASNQPNTIRPMTFDLNPMMDKPDFLLSPFGHTLVRCL